MAVTACRCPSQARDNDPSYPEGWPTHFPPVYPFPTPGPALGGHSGGFTNISFSPDLPEKHYHKQRKRVKQLHRPHKRKETERKRKNTSAHYSSTAPCSSPPASSISTSGTSSSSTSGALAPGDSLFFSFRGGGGDRHPLDACWAILLAIQPSALAL